MADYNSNIHDNGEDDIYVPHALVRSVDFGRDTPPSTENDPIVDDDMVEPGMPLLPSFSQEAPLPSIPIGSGSSMPSLASDIYDFVQEPLNNNEVDLDLGSIESLAVQHNGIDLDSHSHQHSAITITRCQFFTIILSLCSVSVIAVSFMILFMTCKRI